MPGRGTATDAAQLTAGKAMRTRQSTRLGTAGVGCAAPDRDLGASHVSSQEGQGRVSCTGCSQVVPHERGMGPSLLGAPGENM